MTLTFKRMQPEHLPGAVRISTAVGWPHRVEDWAFVFGISQGFVALQGENVVATALSTPFGSAAMSNLILVDAALRGQGVGRRIMELAMALVDADTWHLVATPDGLPLYEKLGFRGFGEVSQHQGHIGDIAPMDGVIWANETDFPAILELDHAASQMDRSNLYNALMTTGRFAIFGGPQRITGCAAVRRFGRGKVIGPVVAQSNSDAKRLISFVMSQTPGQHIRIDTDTDQGLGPWLVQCGLPKTGSGVRMQKGARLMQKTEPATIFALASQALG